MRRVAGTRIQTIRYFGKAVFHELSRSAKRMNAVKIYINVFEHPASTEYLNSIMGCTDHRTITNIGRDLLVAKMPVRYTSASTLSTSHMSKQTIQGHTFPV
ncbi:unnamed protein product [Toxocara canis]|uniref:Transposase n=1 Tax=Toxocara canis TaxID=6265 RepID=A0A183TYL6_TOXCA|nr:unnamed protein product [Toxocara canis]